MPRPGVQLRAGEILGPEKHTTGFEHPAYLFDRLSLPFERSCERIVVVNLQPADDRLAGYDVERVRRYGMSKTLTAA